MREDKYSPYDQVLRSDYESLRRRGAKLLRFIKSVAKRHYDGDSRPDGTEWDIENDDAHETLVEIIDGAREVVKKAKKS